MIAKQRIYASCITKRSTTNPKTSSHRIHRRSGAPRSGNNTNSNKDAPRGGYDGGTAAAAPLEAIELGTHSNAAASLEHPIDPSTLLLQRLDREMALFENYQPGDVDVTETTEEVPLPVLLVDTLDPCKFWDTFCKKTPQNGLVAYIATADPGDPFFLPRSSSLPGSPFVVDHPDGAKTTVETTFDTVQRLNVFRSPFLQEAVLIRRRCFSVTHADATTVIRHTVRHEQLLLAEGQTADTAVLATMIAQTGGPYSSYWVHRSSVQSETLALALAAWAAPTTDPVKLVLGFRAVWAEMEMTLSHYYMAVTTALDLNSKPFDRFKGQ
jgi:hypothetical protein